MKMLIVFLFIFIAATSASFNQERFTSEDLLTDHDVTEYDSWRTNTRENIDRDSPCIPFILAATDSLILSHSKMNTEVVSLSLQQIFDCIHIPDKDCVGRENHEIQFLDYLKDSGLLNSTDYQRDAWKCKSFRTYSIEISRQSNIKNQIAAVIDSFERKFIGDQTFRPRIIKSAIKVYGPVIARMRLQDTVDYTSSEGIFDSNLCGGKFYPVNILGWKGTDHWIVLIYAKGSKPWNSFENKYTKVSLGLNMCLIESEYTTVVAKRKESLKRFNFSITSLHAFELYEFIGEGCVTSIDEYKSLILDVNNPTDLCKARYAFSIITALECANFIKNQRMVKLSLQQVMDCVPSDNEFTSCKTEDKFHEFVLNHLKGGVMTQKSYDQMPGVRRTCKFDPGAIKIPAEGIRYNPLSLNRLTSSDVQSKIKEALIHGPVLVKAKIDPKKLNTTFNNLLNMTDNTECNYKEDSNHIVPMIIVGWGYNERTDKHFWEVRSNIINPIANPDLSTYASSWFETGVNRCGIEDVIYNVFVDK